MKVVLIAFLLIASLIFHPTLAARLMKTETPISGDPKNLGGHTIKCVGKKNQPLTSCKPPISLKPSPTADKPCFPFPGISGYPICNRPPANRPKP
ncbi:hypothetical protein P8452_02830 [Trifolium repens]|nr:hypothetical protein P8452_02829 [Trifolium repens]WJX12316.1 hypothetical protein P8452_02830 [Trifolium repens]